MTNAEKIAEYAAAAAKSGLPVKELIVEKGAVRVIFGDKEPTARDGGLRKDWTAK